MKFQMIGNQVNGAMKCPVCAELTDLNVFNGTCENCGFSLRNPYDSSITPDYYSSRYQKCFKSSVRMPSLMSAFLMLQQQFPERMKSEISKLDYAVLANEGYTNTDMSVLFIAETTKTSVTLVFISFI